MKSLRGQTTAKGRSDTTANAETKPDSIRWIIIVLLVALFLMSYLTAASSNYQSCLIEAQIVGGDDKFADDCSRWNPLPF